MLRRTLFAAPFAMATLAQGASSPESIPMFREGLEAMSSHLWYVAGVRFEKALATPELDTEGKRTVLFRLAEVRIRDEAYADAEKILAAPELKDLPETRFWTALMLAGKGRPSAALALLDDASIGTEAPHRIEAIFTRASLEKSLGKNQAAIDTLAPLLTAADPQIASTARLRSAELYLLLNLPEKALAILPPEGGAKNAGAAAVKLLRARALLAKGEGSAAMDLFSGLLADRSDASSRLQQQDAAIGLAQARLAAGLRSEAADGLIAYLRENKSSPRLGPVFEQLYRCIPENDVAPNDAILMVLESWTPPVPPPPPVGLLPRGGGATTGDGAVSVWPSSSTPPLGDFGAQVIYYRAKVLYREGSVGSKAQARLLFLRLRTESPSHPLTLRSMLDQANWDLAEKRTGEAVKALDTLQTAAAGDEKEASLELVARLTGAKTFFQTGDFSRAAPMLEEAAAVLTGYPKILATVNAGSALLAAGDLPSFDVLAQDGSSSQTTADLALERALFLASKRDPGALKALDQFILANPNHARIAEARLASAHAALESSPPDLVLAKAQLDSIPENSRLPAGTLVLAQIRLAAHNDKWEEAAALAQNFLTAHPNDPRQTEVNFELGYSRYKTGEYNAALLILEKLATTHPDHPLAQPALLLAARSAAQATAREQSIGLFDKVIAGNGPLSDLARLEKADVQIYRLKRLPDAISGLDPWVKSMKKDDPVRISAGLLLGEALYANGQLDQALALYNELLASLPADSPRRFELQYRSGLALEKQKEPGKALDAYYSVLNAVSPDTQVADWQWIDRCGVGARRLLEDAQKWEAAISIAEKHARLGSPGAEEADKRANTLRLEHMIMK